MIERPYGTWASSISAQRVAEHGLRLSAVTVKGDDVYWVEGRPLDGGRNVLVCRARDGRVADVTPPPFNVRTRVHEYGGGAYLVTDEAIYFSNFADQRLYAVAPGIPEGPERSRREPVAITPEGRWFYADAAADRRRRRLICVREDHSVDGEPANTLVGIPLGGGPTSGDVLASGFDFYSTPRLNPQGTVLSWLAWRHPQMPWDGTELWAADVSQDGALARARRVAGGEAESIYQPGWLPDGTLLFASDRDGWWRLYRATSLAASEPVVVPLLREPPAAAEFGRPQWLFGTATWAVAGPSRVVASYTQGGRWRLATVDCVSGSISDVGVDLEPDEWLDASASHATLIADNETTAPAVVQVDLLSGEVETVRSGARSEPGSNLTPIAIAAISRPEAVEFDVGDGDRAHAFYYPPSNPQHAAPAGERPPLIVVTHGGPTSAASAGFDLKVQFWTSRGFAVADVNYRGSSGYGRDYRTRLNGRWGIADVTDVVSAAMHLVSRGKADPARLIIRGGSAGGYTTLAALAFRAGVFKAGASYYGVGDLEALAHETHKFESRYLDTLIGPYPAARDVYRARSPIHVAERMACPLILFQGLDDKVVPPSLSEEMAAVVRRNGWPVAYLAFEGEQHGFRKAGTIMRCLEAELFFYGAVFGFTPADVIEPVAVENLRDRT